MSTLNEVVERMKSKSTQRSLFEVDLAARKRLREELEKFLKDQGVKSYTIEEYGDSLAVRFWWK